MDPASFVTNMAITCDSQGIIRDDGKRRTFFDLISDIFQGKHKSDHFAAVCRNLAEDATIEEMGKISKEDQLKIIGRICQIQRKIKNKNVRKECGRHIEEIEKKCLLEQDVGEYSKILFEMIDEASKKGKKEKQVGKLLEVVDYFSRDEKSLSKIVTAWSHSTENATEASTPLHRGKSRIARSLFEREQEVLRGDHCDAIHFEQFPMLLRPNLENAYRNGDQKEIRNQVRILQELMDRYSDNPIFIQGCLSQVDGFLGESVFAAKKNMQLSEKRKKELQIFSTLFPVVDRHLPSLNEEKLVLNLKIKFANLPCQKPRKVYPNLVLGQKEQLDILVHTLQQKEDRHIDSLIAHLEKNNPSPKDIPTLVKLVSTKSALHKKNRIKLRKCLEKRLRDERPKDWEDFREVKSCFEKVLLEVPGDTPHIEAVKRISKSKWFFESQVDLPEEMIRIPRRYHATRRFNVYKLVDSGKVEVNQKVGYRGAWVSTGREEGFGPYAFSFTNEITELDPEVSIQNVYSYRRWRGVQKAIPFQSEGKTVYLAALSVPTDIDKMAQKADKLQLTKELKKRGFPDTKIFSVKQLDFIQNEVMEILGTPNLPDQWWGKGEESNTTKKD